MARPTTAAISPFFIVSDVEKSVAYYRETLGFEATLQEPAQRPFFAIIRRDGAQVFLKADKDATPRPNPQRHPSMRWDAFVYTPDPDGLAAAPKAAQSSKHRYRTPMTACAASNSPIRTAMCCFSDVRENKEVA